ncbi:hypothetical protein TNIN_20341 [Trichonephila inaurata madagascariensis]|uniref:Pre-C2HC domain-containing protein n=1 Tax=Trichonephila inaurata madagascariensis TaxID=2747483 RepID=A0A8X6IG87_9ARAC|nr:hypothetical protein TNIN_20341 [Trichonephila inaurata madagascariensis]
MPVEDIVKELEEVGIHPEECKVMISRRTGLPMPLFSVFLERTLDNKNSYNLKELCSMKIKKPELREVRKAPSDKGLHQDTCGRTDVLPLPQGKHPANYIGCPRNPLNRPPPPPKVNFWEERARKKQEMLEAAKAKSNLQAQPPNLAPAQAEETTSSTKPQAPPSFTRDTSRTTPVGPQASSHQQSSPIDIFAQVNGPEVR